MEMVTHHAKPEQIHAEHASEELQPILNPLSSVIVVLTRNRIISAKEPTSHTPIDAMHDLNLILSQHFTSIHTSHDSSSVFCVEAELEIENVQSGKWMAPRFLHCSCLAAVPAPVPSAHKG